jgi:hypothetical protein
VRTQIRLLAGLLALGLAQLAIGGVHVAADESMPRAAGATRFHTSDGRIISVFGDGAPGCATVSSTRWVSPGRPGQALATPDPAAATVVKFSTPSGTSGEQRIPPASWTPLTASDEELAFYGYEPRPAESQALTQWLRDAARYSGFSAPGFCTLDITNPPMSPVNGTSANGSVSNTATSVNWSGVINHAGSITKIYGHEAIATSSGTPCNNGLHSSWVGMGAYNGKLLQNGIGHNGTGTTYAWWEAIDPTHDSGEHQMSIAVFDGQSINISTEYFPATGQVQFSIHNLTNGQILSPIMSTIDGIPVSSFYDGNDAEAIDERPSVGGFNAQLRNYGHTTWSNVMYYQGSTSHAIRTFPEDGIIMQNDSHTKNLSTPDGSGYPNDSFRDNWNACS